MLHAFVFEQADVADLRLHDLRNGSLRTNGD